MNECIGFGEIRDLNKKKAAGEGVGREELSFTAGGSLH